MKFIGFCLIGFLLCGPTHAEPCDKILRNLSAEAFRESLYASYTRPQIRAAQRWLNRFPINEVGVAGDYQFQISLKHIWLEFLLELSKPNVREEGLILSIVDPQNQLANFHLTPALWNKWETLGLVLPEGGLNPNADIEEVGRLFRRHSKAAGFAIRAEIPDTMPHHWKGSFYSSKKFAEALLGGVLPFDDMHAIFFHAADLIDPVGQKYFLWLVRFLELEALYHIASHQGRSEALTLGESIFHMYFEGTTWPDAQRLVGFIQLASLHLRGLTCSSSWEALGFTRALAQGPKEIETYIREHGLPLPRDDYSQLKWIVPALLKLAAHMDREMGSRAFHLYARGIKFKRLYGEFVQATQILP